MNRSVITIAFIFCFCVSAEPIKSMIGAASISIISQDGGTPLPEGVVAVEYIEGTGTQYIDTGVNPAEYSSWEAVILCLPSSKTISLTGYAYHSLGIQSVGINAQGNWAQTQIHASLIKPTLVIANREGQFFDGIKGNSNDIGKGNLYLFHRCIYLNQYPWKGRIYYANYSIQDILVREFIPCRFINEVGNEEGAMYDIVTGELFRNKGTGYFIIGPDKE